MGVIEAECEDQEDNPETMAMIRAYFPDPGANVPGVGDPAIVAALEAYTPPWPATRPDRMVGIRRGDGYTRYGLKILLYGHPLSHYEDVRDPGDGVPPPAIDHLIRQVHSKMVLSRDSPPIRYWQAARAAGVEPRPDLFLLNLGHVDCLAPRQGP